MVRILLWRLTFETLTLLKRLGFHGPSTRYFAYGANLDPEVMKSRGMTILASEAVLLRDFIFRFNHDVPFVGVGMASIEKCPGKEVPGIVYTLPKIDEWLMDCYEAHAWLRRYLKGKVQVQGETCYYYYSSFTDSTLMPLATYRQKIINGYKKYWPEDSDFIHKLEAQPTLAEMKPRMPPGFMIRNYGKLGQWAKPLLVFYDGLCVKVFVYFLFRPSVFKRK